METFARVLGDPALPHLFFVEGGALAVENALKAAFDWKSRRNEAAGRSPGLGTQVMHLTRAFHGRSGYTLSLTNTDPAKTDRFPKFDWPRIDVPAIRFPLEDHLDEVEAAEERALAQARRPSRPTRTTSPASSPSRSRERAATTTCARSSCWPCSSCAATTTPSSSWTRCRPASVSPARAWAYQQLGLEPDIVAFAKKVQVGGIMAGRRVDEVADNVFKVSGRINSTWGGGLVDMVRSRRLLELIERDGLIDPAAETGELVRRGAASTAGCATPIW